MEEEILEFVRQNRHVSFVELLHKLGQPARGTAALELNGEKFSNIVLWLNCSMEFIEAIKNLLDRKLITLNSASLLSYLIDGELLTLPIAKRERHYKKPHWAPMVLNPVEPC